MAIVSSPSAATPTAPTAPVVPPADNQLPDGTNLMGVMLLLVADAMVLVALLAIWFTIKGGSPSWPPRDVSVGTYLASTVTITAVMSAFSMQWAVSSIRRNDQRSGTIALVLTVFLGLAMANAQWYSMFKAEFGVGSHAYGTLYHLLIGYHLFHVVLATGALVLVGARALAGHYGRQGYDPMRATAALWHYGVVSWFVIMTAMFLFSAHA